MIDISTIPAPRLAMLDNTTLFHGNHRGGNGKPECRHCARELLHEVVTGQHKDATPPGASKCIAILPGINDGPWRDDDHRTSVLRPYLRKLLGLDPAKDEQRLYAILNYAYRHIMPEICDALKLDEHGAALRALPAIIDRGTANKSTDIFVEAAKDAHALSLDIDLDLDLDLSFGLDIALSHALALDLDLDLALSRALGLARDLDLDLARARDLDLTLGLARGLARASGLARHRALAGDLTSALARHRALTSALARGLTLTSDRTLTLTSDRDRDRAVALTLASALAESWEHSVTALLDIICGM